MRPRSENIRLRKIADAQRKLARGIYDKADELDRMLDGVLTDTGPGSLIDDLRRCPVGAGHRYRDLVFQALQHSLNGYIDDKLSATEGSSGGGRLDIELPLRYTALRDEVLFQEWGRRYGLKSLIAECKNQKGRASLSDYRQLRDYLETAGRGRVGLLIARNGFAKTVRERVIEEARRGSTLVLLIEEDELLELAAVEPGDAPEWFYRKEVRTLQAA